MHSNSGRRRVLLLVGLLHKVIVQKRGERRVARAELLIDHVIPSSEHSMSLPCVDHMGVILQPRRLPLLKSQYRLSNQLDLLRTKYK